MKPKPIDFETLKRNDKPNSYLVCPANYCHTKIDMIAPIYQASIEEVQRAWKQLLSKQPRLTQVQSLPSEHYFQYIQRSRIFRFPDYITIQFLPLDRHKTTLAIYSNSVYGHYDFNVNQQRITRWLSQLSQQLES